MESGKNGLANLFPNIIALLSLSNDKKGSFWSVWDSGSVLVGRTVKTLGSLTSVFLNKPDPALFCS